VLELGRRTRPRPYGLIGWFEPLIPRELRLEVPERMDAEGAPVVPLDEAAVRAAVRRLAEAGCESLVIHFLHSYINPAHERRVRELAAEMTKLSKAEIDKALDPARQTKPGLELGSGSGG